MNGGTRATQAAARRATVVQKLRARRAEVIETITAGVSAVAEPTGAEVPGYLEGLREAIEASVDHAFDLLETGGGERVDIPAQLLVQARLAARSQIGLEVVLRRYAAGYRAIASFLMAEASALGTSAGRLLFDLERELASLFDQLVAAIGEEYQAEVARVRSSRHRDSYRLLSRLLEGEATGAPGIAYDFSGHHLCVISASARMEGELRSIAGRIDRGILFLEPRQDPLCAWFGGRRLFDDDLEAFLAELAGQGGAIGIGEPSAGLSGWRLSYRQASSAFAFARRTGEPVARYRDVGFLAAVARDEDLTAYLSKTYLKPLESDRDGGAAMRQTLSVYLRSDRNASSAAAALGIARQTVASRLTAAERKIGRPLRSCGTELEVALRLLIKSQAPGTGARTP